MAKRKTRAVTGPVTTFDPAAVDALLGDRRTVEDIEGTCPDPVSRASAFRSCSLHTFAHFLH